MSEEALTPATWKPAGANAFRSYLGRMLSFPAYPVLFSFVVLCRSDATVENARWWRRGFAFMGFLSGCISHALIAKRWTTDPLSPKHALAHLGVFLTVGHPFIWMSVTANQLIDIFSMDRPDNRLRAGKIHGPRVLVVGNGPSALNGEPLGHVIDKFDEVIRFNNFQTKTAGMDKWVGTKTTVHFSDGVLYPTYKEYNVPGATVMLSLMMDCFIVAGSYVILRMAADLQTSMTCRFLKDPAVGWIEKHDIERLKKELDLKGVKHPTSGMLAIDYFIRKKGVQLPVYIHGFDFFMGPKMHYFDDHEPLYERINDRIGVNMHSPHKEKTYVESLIAQGKVRFLKDMAGNS